MNKYTKIAIILVVYIILAFCGYVFGYYIGIYISDRYPLKLQTNEFNEVIYSGD